MAKKKASAAKVKRKVKVSARPPVPIHMPLRTPRRIKALQKFLSAYGAGEEGHHQRERFAKRLDTSLPYLVHLSYGYRTASAELALKIERGTYGLVRCEDMRPDIDWAYFARRHPAPHPSINAAR